MHRNSQSWDSLCSRGQIKTLFTNYYSPLKHPPNRRVVTLPSRELGSMSKKTWEGLLWCRLGCVFIQFAFNSSIFLWTDATSSVLLTHSSGHISPRHDPLCSGMWYVTCCLEGGMQGWSTKNECLNIKQLVHALWRIIKLWFTREVWRGRKKSRDYQVKRANPPCRTSI